MHWSRLLDRYPEIAHLRASERQALWHAVRWAFARDWRTWVLYVPLLLAPSAMMAGAFLLPMPARNSDVFWVALPVVFLGSFVAQWFVRAAIWAEAVRRETLRRGIRPACCFECGYDLRACEGDRCSECGAVFRGAALHDHA